MNNLSDLIEEVFKYLQSILDIISSIGSWTSVTGKNSYSQPILRQPLLHATLFDSKLFLFKMKNT